MLIGNASLRMRGSRLQHTECDDNEWKCQSAAHTAIISAVRKP